MKSRELLIRATVLALMTMAGQSAHALTQPNAWTKDRGSGNSCAGCHGFGYARSSTLANALATPTTLHTYVTGLNQNAYMNGLDSGDSSLTDTKAILPYILQSNYGELSATGLLPVAGDYHHSYTLPFSDTVVNGSRSVTITLTNANDYWGDAQDDLSYSISGITNNSSNTFYYSSQVCQDNTAAATAAGTVPRAGGQCALTVVFSPNSSGSKSASLLLNIGGITRTVSLSGLATAPVASLSASSIPFGSIQVGNSSSSTVTLSNTGTATLTLGTVTVSGDYSLSGANTCTNGHSVSAGSNCTLGVTFSPSTTGTRNGSVSITHNAAGSPSSVSLSGTGTPAPAPSIGANAANLSFGDVVQGNTAQQTVTLTNTGNATLTFSSIALSGTHSADFSRTTTCGATLAQSATCNVQVTFTAGTLGNRSATLAINSDASNGNLSLPLSATSKPVPAPVVSLSGSSVAFGSQTVGGLYPARTVTLTNTGDAALAIASLSSNNTHFTLSHDCGSSLAAAATCTLTLRYVPAAANSGETANITLTSNAAGSPHTVALTAQGVAFAAPALSLSPAGPVDFGTVNVGQVSATQTFTLSNAGPGGATLGLLHTVGTQAAQFGVTAGGTCVAGTPLYQGSSCTVIVQFNPGMPGPLSADLEVTASTNGAPLTAAPVALTGTGSGGPTAILELSQTALRFDATRVGNTSATDNVEVWNKGSGPMVVSNASVSGPYWVETGDCGAMPFQLAPGQHCTLKVGFKPDASGMREGALSITSTAANSVSTTLSGEGQAPMSTSGGGAGSLSWGWLAGLAALVATRRWRASMALPLVAGALALGSAPDAQAQFDAEVHGIVDYSYGRFEPSGLYRTYRVNSNSLSPSFVGGSVRYGFDGGYTVGLNLETFLRFQDLKGGRNDDDPMLSRNNFLLANTPYGNMRFGRLQSYLFDTTTRFNAFGNSVPFSPAMRQTFAGGNLMGLQGDFYWNRAFSYTSPNLEGFTVNVMQSKGEKKDPASLTGVNVVWQRGVFSAALSGQQVYLNNGIDDPTNEKVWQLGVSYNLGFARLFGLHTRTNDLGLMVHSRSTSAGVRLPLGPGDVIAQAAFGKARGVAVERLQQTLSVGYIFPWDSEIDLYMLGMDDRVRDQTRGASVAAGIRWRFQ